MTEAVAGRPLYGSREIKLTLSALDPAVSPGALQNLLVPRFQGKLLKLTPDDDPEHYYLGRCSITNVGRQGKLAVAEMEFACRPFRVRWSDGGEEI